MLNERFQIQAEQDAIVDSTPIAVKKDWQYRGNVMHVELWTPGWTLFDGIVLNVTSATAGMKDVHVTDTTGLVAGNEYLITDGTHSENIKVDVVNTGTNFTIVTALSYSYTTGATVKRSNFTVFTGHASAANNQVMYIGPLESGNNDAVKTLIIKRTETNSTLTVYYKNAANTESWTSCAITATRYSGTAEYEVEYAVPTRGLTDFKIVCNVGSGGTDVVIHSMFFMDVTEFKTITSNTTFYLSPSGNDSTGKGTELEPWRTLGTALLYLQDYWIASNVTVTMQLDDGPYAYSDIVTVDHPCGDRIIIRGKTDKTVNITSLVSTNITYSGTDYEIWNVVLGVGSTYQIAAEDYILIHTLPTDAPEMYGLGSLFGCHKITNVNEGTGRITIEVRTSKVAVPDPVLIPATSAIILKTVINTTAQYGIWLKYNQSLGMLYNLAIVGMHSESNAVGVGAMESSTITMARVGIIGFNSYGIQCQHGSDVICYEKFGLTGPIALTANVNGTYVKANSTLSSYLRFIISGSSSGHIAESGVIYMHPDAYVMSGLYDYGVKCLTNSFVFIHNPIIFGVVPLDSGGASTGYIFYSAMGGYLWINGGTTDIGSNGTAYSPANDTVGNYQAYIHVG